MKFKNLLLGLVAIAGVCSYTPELVAAIDAALIPAAPYQLDNNERTTRDINAGYDVPLYGDTNSILGEIKESYYTPFLPLIKNYPSSISVEVDGLTKPIPTHHWFVTSKLPNNQSLGYFKMDEKEWAWYNFNKYDKIPLLQKLNWGIFLRRFAILLKADGTPLSPEQEKMSVLALHETLKMVLRWFNSNRSLLWGNNKKYDKAIYYLRQHLATPLEITKSSDPKHPYSEPETMKGTEFDEILSSIDAGWFRRRLQD